MNRFVLPLLVTLTMACATNTTIVRTHDARDIALEIDTLQGKRLLLPPGGGPLEVELPRTSPPYGPTVLYPASAIRDEAGGIAIRCDACTGAPAMHLDLGDGVFTFDGPASQHLDWREDSLRILHIDYPYYVPGGYRGRLMGPFEAFAVDVVTPTRNVEVREKRVVHRGAGAAALVVGLVLDVVGVYAAGREGSSSPLAADGLATGSTLSLLFGVPVTVAGLVTLLMASKDERVSPGR